MLPKNLQNVLEVEEWYKHPDMWCNFPMNLSSFKYLNKEQIILSPYLYFFAGFIIVERSFYSTPVLTKVLFHLLIIRSNAESWACSTFSFEGTISYIDSHNNRLRTKYFTFGFHSFIRFYQKRFSAYFGSLKLLNIRKYLLSTCCNKYIYSIADRKKEVDLYTGL